MDFNCQCPNLARWLYENFKDCGKLLDIGCGNKWYHKFLASESGKIISLDAWKKFKPNIHLDISIKPLPFDDLFFDNILMLDVIEHIEKEAGIKALKEVQRVCKGKLMLLTPLFWSENKTSAEDTGSVYYKNHFNYHKSLWEEDDFNKDEGWEKIIGILPPTRYYVGIWKRK